MADRDFDKEWSMLQKLKETLQSKKNKEGLSVREENELDNVYDSLNKIKQEAKEAAKQEKDAAKERERASDDEKNAAEAREDAADAEKDATKERENESDDTKNSNKSNTKSNSKSRRPLFSLNFGRGSGSRSTPSSTSTNAAGMTLYILLLILSFAAFFVKGFIGFQPGISISISIVVGLLFFFVIVGTPEHSFAAPLVIIAIALDFLPFFNFLEMLPETTQSILLQVHIFIWPVLAGILFILGIIDNLKQQNPLGTPTKIILIAIFAVILFLLMSFFAGSTTFAQTYQDQAFSEYIDSTKKVVEVVDIGYTETKNSIGDFLSCGIIMTNNYDGTSSSDCLTEKKATRYCKEKFNEDEELQKECIKVKTQGTTIINTKETSRKEATKLELEFDKAHYKGTFLDSAKFPLLIKYYNPTDSPIIITGNCVFQPQGMQGKSIKGSIMPSSVSVPATQGKAEEDVLKIDCVPQENVEGKYDLIFNVTAHNMKTDSTLTRFFIRERSRSLLNSLLESELGTTSKDESLLSMEKKMESKFGSADVPQDYVTFGIGMGTTSTANPVIVGSEEVTLVLHAENKGKGKLLQINSYEVNVDAPCAKGELISLSNKKLQDTTIKFAECPVSILYNLESPEQDYIESRVQGKLFYDYEIQTKKSIKVLQS